MTDTYLGLASLVVIAASIALWIRALRHVEIPKNRGGFVAAWVVAAGLGVTALAGEPGWLGGIPAGFAVFASAFFLLTRCDRAARRSRAMPSRWGTRFPNSRRPMNTDRRSTHRAWQGIRCSSSSFADIGDPTVSPSYGDGKSSGPNSTSVA